MRFLWAIAIIPLWMCSSLIGQYYTIRLFCCTYRKQDECSCQVSFCSLKVLHTKVNTFSLNTLDNPLKEINAIIFLFWQIDYLTISIYSSLLLELVIAYTNIVRKNLCYLWCHYDAPLPLVASVMLPACHVVCSVSYSVLLSLSYYCMLVCMTHVAGSDTF